MSQYKTGTATVTNGSPTVTGTNTLWLANVTAGDSFTVAGDGVMYDVASVDTDTQITLSAPYAGTTASGVVYAIGTGFTVPDSFPEMSQGDIETATIFTRAMRGIQGRFTGIESNTTNEIGQAVNDHVALPDPHTQYLKESEYEAHRSREDLLKQATLSLDFANNKYEVYEGPVNSLTQMPFNEAFTFTRGTTATARNAIGGITDVAIDEQRLVGNREGLLIEEERENLLQYPRMFDNVVWVGTGASVKANAKVSPNGQAQSYKLVEDSENSGHRVNTSISGNQDDTYTVFAVVAPGERNHVALSVVATNSRAQASFNLTDGTVRQTRANGTLTLINAGTLPLLRGYFIVWLTFSNTAESYVQIRTYVDDGVAALTDSGPVYQGDGASGVFLFHLQMEKGSFPTSIIPDATTFTSRSTVASFVDSAGVLQEAAIDVARDAAYKYIDGILYPIGLLLEAAATNLFLNSDTLSTQNVTVGAEPHTLHFTGSGSVALSGAFTGSLAGTGTGENNRVSLTFTPTAGTLTVTVTGTITNAMVEEGLYATSYFSSGGSQGVRAPDISASPAATREADDCVRTLGDEFNPNEFSFYLEAPIPRLFDDRNAHLIEFSDGSNNNRYLLQRVVNSTDLVFAGVTSANGVIFTMTLGIAAFSNQTAKISASVSSTSATLVVDGVSVSDTVSDALPVVTQFNLGAKWDGSNSIGEAVFKDVQLLPTALSESELITLTGGTP